MRYLTVARNLLLIVAGLALLAGCSISYSSGKSSNSSVSSFSSGGEKEADKAAGTYADDIVAATSLFVSHGGDADAFQRQVAFIAGKHGITAWANDDSTFVAMGKGLKQAGIKEDQITNLPYFSTISSGPKYDLLMKGYK